MKYKGWKLDRTIIDRERKGIAFDIATQCLSEYHKKNCVLSFWDILHFLRGCDKRHEEIIRKKTNRDRFFRYVKVELEDILQTPVERHFSDECGKTDSEYLNWFFKRRFRWNPTGVKGDMR